MYCETIKVADVTMNVVTMFHRAYRLCLPFVTNEEPVLYLRATFEDCLREGMEFEREHGKDAPSDVFLECTALLRKMSDALIDYDAFVMHGAVVAVNGDAYMFCAPSGTGKTTHAQRWLEECPGSYVVNGDKPYVLVRDGEEPLACGSPWCGKEEQCANDMVPLRAIVFLERAKNNAIEHLTFAQAFPWLLQQVYRPDDENKMRQTLQLMQRLDLYVSFWRFQMNNYKDDCFRVAYDALCGCTAETNHRANVVI